MCVGIVVQAQHKSLMHARTQASNAIQGQVSAESLKNNKPQQQQNIEEDIKQLMKQQKPAPASPTSATQYHTVAHSRTNPTFYLHDPPNFQYNTPEAVPPIVLKLSGPASRDDEDDGIQPPAWASQTSNLFAPTPMESMPTPKPVK